MRIVFIVNASPQQLAENQVRLASARYRALMPAAELQRAGFSIDIKTFVHMLHPEFRCNADIVVLQQPKIDLARVPEHLPQIYRKNVERILQSGSLLLLDVSDFKLTPGGADDTSGADPARVAAFRDQLRELHDRSHAIVVPTDTLGRILTDHGIPRDKIHVIADPVEVRPGEPRFAPGDKLKLLWFGMLGSHWKALAPFLQQDLGRISAIMPLELRFICEPVSTDLVKTMAGATFGHYPMRFEQWSVAAVEAALDACDIAIFPFDRSNFSAGKSNNRALQALHAGRFVAAHPIDSYVELSDFCGISEDLPQVIAAALADPAAALERIRQGQQYVQRHYNSAAIGRRWADVVSQVREAAAA